MIRVLNAYFPSRTVFLGISEACIVVLAFVGAAVGRLGSAEAMSMLGYERGYFKILVVSAAFVTCMYYFDLYDSQVLSNRQEVIGRLIQVPGAVCILLAVLYYANPSLDLGRQVFYIGFLAVLVILLCWRRLFLTLNNQPEFAKRAVLFGDGPLAVPLIRELKSRPEVGLRIASHVTISNNGHKTQNCQVRDPVSDLVSAAASDELMREVELHRATTIIVALDDRRGKLPIESLLALKSRGMRVQDAADVYEAVTGKVPIESLYLGRLLFSPGFYVSRATLILERFVSVGLSLLGALLLLPLVPLIALAVKLTSQGPIFYRQKRVGRNDCIFDCYKFRTMDVNAEADTGATWASDDDPRVTPVGRFLRTLRLDEIPQLWNVLKGDMNLVGPRPERPEFVDRFKREVPFYHLRHFIRPGITGWAQIRFGYGSSLQDVKEKLRYDLFYIKNMSVGLDLLVLFHTTKTVLLGRGAK